VALEILRTSGPESEQRLRDAHGVVSVRAYDIADVQPAWEGCGMNRPDGLCDR